MKKLILILTTLITINFASNLSIINPNWAIVDCINNYSLIDKRKYFDYLKIVKETDKIISNNPKIDESIYNKIFKSRLWDKMIKHLEKNKKNPIIKKIIKYMKDIKRKVKEKKIAIV